MRINFTIYKCIIDVHKVSIYSFNIIGPAFFLLVDSQEFVFRFRVEGWKKKIFFFSFSELFFSFSELFFLISPEQTVKLYIYISKVNQQSVLNL